MEGAHMHGVGAGMEDRFTMEKLRELLVALEALRGHGFLPESPPTVPPHDHDWVIPLAFMVVAVVSVVSVFSYLTLRRSKYRADFVDPDALTMDHECAIACLVLVLFSVCSLASFYYYYCYTAGCFGAGGTKPFVKAMPTPVLAGRKFLRIAG